MSNFSIVDGTGSGNSAQVNSLNQVSVQAESISSEGFQARNGNGFIIHYECETAAAPSGGFMHILNNSSIYALEVTRIYIDPHTITPSDLIVTQVFDPTIIGGSDVSSTAIVQKNRSRSDSFDLTIKVSEGGSDMTYTGGTQYHAFPVKTMSPIQRNMNNTNILTGGKSILFGWKTRSGGNATDGDVVSFSVNIVRRLL